MIEIHVDFVHASRFHRRHRICRAAVYCIICMRLFAVAHRLTIQLAIAFGARVISVTNITGNIVLARETHFSFIQKLFVLHIQGKLRVAISYFV